MRHELLVSFLVLSACASRSPSSTVDRLGRPSSLCDRASRTVLGEAEAEFRNGKEIAEMIRGKQGELGTLPIDQAHIEALAQASIPFAPREWLGAGAEKIVFDLGEGRVLKLSQEAPHLPRTFDVPILAQGEASWKGARVYYWIEPRLGPASLEEIVELEKNEILKKKFAIVDFNLDQFGKDESGRVFVLDQKSVEEFPRNPPRTALQYFEYSKLLARLKRVRLPMAPERVDEFLFAQQRELQRIKKLNPYELHSSATESLVAEIEDLLRDIEYPRQN